MMTLHIEAQQRLSHLGVMALYFFGSRAYGLAQVQSDFDFAVLLRDPSAVMRTSSELYQKIYSILSELAKPEILDADVIDIVFLDSPRVPLELKFHVVSHGQLLLDNDPQERANRVGKIMLQQADFAPLRLAMSQALLARL